jgi:uncharacterized membrane protein YqaE (UPF0057 family)
MNLRTSLLTIALCMQALVSFGFDKTMAAPAINTTPVQPDQVEAFFGQMNPESFLAMSPSQLEKMAGRKLSFKEKVGLKALKMKAKKMARLKAAGQGNAAPSIDKGVYIILAIFISFLAVGLATEWEGSDWIICLLLSLICGIPGIIYALIKMKNYYGS